MESEEDFRNMYPTAIGVLNSRMKTPSVSCLLYAIKSSENMFTKNLKGGWKKEIAEFFHFLR